jgi:hypothetical protein
MRRSLVFAFAVTLLNTVSVQAQVGMPGIQYSNTVAAGDGVQLYPYDQQDPWIHGYFQRYPAYGGFSSFRPYNYRHVFSQTQIAQGWGAAHGMPYSQQFWNKYRTSYLDQNLHSQVAPIPHSQSIESQPQPLISRPGMTVYQASTVRPIGYESVSSQVVNQPSVRPETQDSRPMHIFPNR